MYESPSYPDECRLPCDPSFHPICPLSPSENGVSQPKSIGRLSYPESSGARLEAESPTGAAANGRPADAGLTSRDSVPMTENGRLENTGSPASDSRYPTAPLAAETRRPLSAGASSENGNTAMPATPAEGGRPGRAGPSIGIPIFPGVVIPAPPNTGVSNVRFLHAATHTVPVSISVGTQNLATNLRYAEYTGYSRVPDGFRTVTVISARSPRSILFRKTIPFRACECTTLVLVNTSSGVDLLQVPDTACNSMPRGLSCFRMVNASYGSMPLDVILFDGRIVFSEIGFKEVTTFRRVRPGEYGFYLAATPPMPFVVDEAIDIETMEDLPISISDHFIPGYGELIPLATFYESFRSGVQYTGYVLGRGTSEYPYFVTTLQN